MAFNSETFSNLSGLQHGSVYPRGIRERVQFKITAWLKGEKEKNAGTESWEIIFSVEELTALLGISATNDSSGEFRG